MIVCSGPEVGFRDCGRLARETAGDCEASWGCAGLAGEGLWVSPSSTHCAAPAWLPLCRSLHSPTACALPVLRPPWGCQHADLPASHPSPPVTAIIVTVQGFPPGSGMIGEQEGAARGSGPQGRHMGGEVPGATATLPILTRWGEWGPGSRRGSAGCDPQQPLSPRSLASRRPSLTSLSGSPSLSSQSSACTPEGGDSCWHLGGGLCDVCLYCPCLTQGRPRSRCITSVPPLTERQRLSLPGQSGGVSLMVGGVMVSGTGCHRKH